MLLDLNKLQVVNDLQKSITRKEAQTVHKELPPGGVWRTIRGHHVYVLNGKIVAGAGAGKTGKAIKLKKEHLDEHQKTVDKEAKEKKKDAKKAPKKAGKADKSATDSKKPQGKKSAKPEVKPKAKGAGKDAIKPTGKSDSSAVRKPAKAGTKPAKAETKPSKTASGTKDKGGKQNATATKPTNADKPKATGKAGEKAGKAEPKKKSGVKDIRSEKQTNNAIAYDVGVKVGGARKDLAISSFTESPTARNLKELESVSPETAQVTCIKKNILKPVDFAQEHKNGADVNTAMLKQLIFDRIAPKPADDTSEGRSAYLNSITQLHRILAPVKSWGEMGKAISDLGNIARDGERGEEAEQKLGNRSGYSYFNEDYYNQLLAKGKEAKGMLDFSPMGEKLVNFFTDYDARKRTISTLAKRNLTWDKLLNPEEKEKPKTTQAGEERKRWERRAVSEHSRKGGKETPVQKPEDMVKTFGMRSVEFGNWVDDASGLFHLKRSAEAFHDLAGTIGVSDKEMSLNGRLAMAFGARGSGGALAHYEPTRKVINMTKYGGAGSLAHEWGHAMDNILYQYSHGGRDSVNLASEGMGDNDPELKAHYEKLTEAMKKGVPGGKMSGTKKVYVDTSDRKNQYSSYYPKQREMIRNGASMDDTIRHFTKQENERADKEIGAINRMEDFYIKTYGNKAPDEIAKRIQKVERSRSRTINEIPHRIAYEVYRHTGNHVTGEYNVPTGHSEYYSRMQDEDGKSRKYYQTNPEMFARVFESYVEDKMTKSGRKNNYLVHSTTEKDVEAGAPFPKGEERQYLFGLMDKLVNHVTKGGALKKALVMERLANWEGTGNVTEELRKSLPEIFDNLWKENVDKSFSEADHPRDEAGRFSDVQSQHEQRMANVRSHTERLRDFASRFGSADEFAEAVDKPGYGGTSIGELFGMIDNNSHNHLDAGAIKAELSRGGSHYYLTTVDPNKLYVQYEDAVEGVRDEAFDQSKAKPVVVGEHNFIVDGRHRTLNARQSGASEILAYVPARMFYHIHVGVGGELIKSFTEGDHPRDRWGRFIVKQGDPNLKVENMTSEEYRAMFQGRIAHNNESLGNAGVADNTYMTTGYGGKFEKHGADDTMQALNKEGFNRQEMAKHLAGKGKEKFTMRTKNVAFTFHPQVHEASADGQPKELKYKVDVKTAHSEIKGATLLLRRQVQKNSKRGRTLPKHAQRETGMYTLMFDFPKKKTQVDLWSDVYEPSSPMVREERYAYLHPELSTADNVGKVADILMRLVHAEWKDGLQKSFEESKHPRQTDGKFGNKAVTAEAKPTNKKKPSEAKPKATVKKKPATKKAEPKLVVAPKKKAPVKKKETKKAEPKAKAPVKKKAPKEVKPPFEYKSDGLTSEQSKAVVKTLQKLMTRFPEVKILGVSSYKELGEAYSKEYIKAVGTYSIKEKRIGLNEKKLATRQIKSSLSKGQVNTITPEGSTRAGFTVDPTLEGTLTHEFGHALFSTLFNAYEISPDAPKTTAPWTMVDQTSKEFVRHLKAKYGQFKEKDPLRFTLGLDNEGTEHISRYGLSDPEEFFCEAFTEYMNNPKPRPIAKEFGRRLEVALKVLRGAELTHEETKSLDSFKMYRGAGHTHDIGKIIMNGGE